MKPPSISSMACFYRLLLMLYPRGHRRDYGPLMEQLFRDQCRQVIERPERGGLLRLWWRALTDLIVSALSEHITVLIHTMKTQNINKLSVTLLVAAIFLSAIAAPSLVTLGAAPVCLYLSTLALLARAGVECYRAPDEWGRGLLWMAGMLVIYGLIFPFWAKMHSHHGTAYPSIPIVDAGALFLNAAVAMLRPLIPRLGGSAAS